MHAVTWSSCHGRAGKFSLPACHAAFKASSRHASHGRGRHPGSVWAATGGPHMTSACTCAHHGMHTSSHHHEHRQVITIGELMHRSHRQDRAINVASASFVHRHRSFIIVTRLVTVKSGDRQVITTGDRHRHRQVRRPASYHYRRPASFIVKSSRTRD